MGDFSFFYELNISSLGEVKPEIDKPCIQYWKLSIAFIFIAAKIVWRKDYFFNLNFYVRSLERKVWKKILKNVMRCSKVFDIVTKAKRLNSIDALVIFLVLNRL